MRAFFLCATLLLAGCTQESSSIPSGGGAGAFRLERFCSAPDLPQSLRHTYLLIDEHAISKADTPEAFDVIVLPNVPGDRLANGVSEDAMSPADYLNVIMASLQRLGLRLARTLHVDARR